MTQNLPLLNDLFEKVEMDNFFGFVWVVVLLVGGYSIYYFLFHVVRDSMPETVKRDSKTNIVAFFMVVVIIFLVLGFAFGKNN